MTRSFRLDEDVSLGPRSDLVQLKHLRNWRPDGLLCALGPEAVEQLITSLAQPPPRIVNLYVAKVRLGLAIVTASFPRFVEMGSQHLRQQGLRTLACLDLNKDFWSALRRQEFEGHVRESSGKLRPEICDVPAAQEYIKRHACSGLNVERLLQDTQHVCAKTFHTHFKAATGLTPGDAIKQHQLAEARRLLADTRLPMTTIAECCSFCNSSSFARAFRAAHGTSPMDYRKQAQTE